MDATNGSDSRSIIATRHRVEALLGRGDFLELLENELRMSLRSTDLASPMHTAVVAREKRVSICTPETRGESLAGHFGFGMPHPAPEGHRTNHELLSIYLL